jgi:hypothetical protein
VGVNEYGAGGMGGVSVLVSVDGAKVGNVGVLVGCTTNWGVPVAGIVTCVPEKLHEDKNRHSTANFETKNNLDFIPHRLKRIDYLNSISTQSLGRRLSLNCNPFD